MTHLGRRQAPGGQPRDGTRPAGDCAEDDRAAGNLRPEEPCIAAYSAHAPARSYPQRVLACGPGCGADLHAAGRASSRHEDLLAGHSQVKALRRQFPFAGDFHNGWKALRLSFTTEPMDPYFELLRLAPRQMEGRVLQRRQLRHHADSRLAALLTVHVAEPDVHGYGLAPDRDAEDGRRWLPLVVSQLDHRPRSESPAARGSDGCQGGQQADSQGTGTFDNARPDDQAVEEQIGQEHEVDAAREE